jgi:hypothetical protein
MLLFLWTDDSMTGAVASDHIEPVVFVNWDGATSPEDLADQAYDDCAAKDAGRRCVFFRHFADGERTGHVQIGANSVEDFFANRRGEFDKVRSEQFRFWETWRAKGSVRPDRIALDEEEGIGVILPGSFSEATWAERAAKIAKVNNHPFLDRYSPEQLRAYTQANMAAFSSWDSGVGKALMWWAHNNTQIFLDTMSGAVAPVYSAVLGEACPPVSNYGDEVLRETRYGLQTEPYYYGTRSVGGLSAPYLYVNRFSSLPPIFTGQTNEHRWLMFLYNNNWMRAIRRTASLEPWFSYPSWDGLTHVGDMQSSRYMVQAAAAMGAEHGMMWSPPSGMGVGSVPSLSTQLAYMEATLADLPARQVDDDERMTQLAYNATTVTIGDWSVTYSAGDWDTI